MPQIPACSAAVSALALAFLQNKAKIPAAAQRTFDKALPPPYRLTRERYDSNVNVIKEAMGQGAVAMGSVRTTDEAVMLVKAKL